jgi:hypothetical protein
VFDSEHQSLFGNLDGQTGEMNLAKISVITKRAFETDQRSAQMTDDAGNRSQLLAFIVLAVSARAVFLAWFDDDYESHRI